MYKAIDEKARKWYRLISGRIMQVCFKCRGPDLVFTNVYAPHTWKNKSTNEEVYNKRQDFFQQLNEIMIESESKTYHIACGDWNIRVHGRLETEEDVIRLRAGGHLRQQPSTRRQRPPKPIHRMPQEQRTHTTKFILPESRYKGNKIRLGGSRTTVQSR